MNTYKVKAVPSRDLYEILRAADLVPANCGDVIIEMRVGEAVKIHTQSFPDERICDALKAFVKAAKAEPAPAIAVTIEDDQGVFKDMPQSGLGMAR